MEIPLTVADHLRRAELVYGDRIAVVDEPDQAAPPLPDLTYRRMAELAKAMAAGLDGMGLDLGARVAIVSHNAARMLVFLFGTSAFGRIGVPINFRLNAEEVQYIVDHSGAEVLLMDPELEPTLGDVKVEQRLLTGEESDSLFVEGMEPRPWTPDERATATINYTSGTTARPKGVEMTHRNLWLNAATFGWHTLVNDRDVYLHTLPMFHCNGWCYTWAVTSVGGTHICLRRVNSEDIFSLVAQYSATHMCAAPSVLSMLEASPLASPSALNGIKIFTGGAPPAPRILRAMQVLGAELHHLYGLTETYGPATIAAVQPGWDELSIEEQARMKSRQGVPVTTSHVGVRVVDEKMNDVPADAETIGEVAIRGNTVMAGYYRDPEATHSSSKGGWFHTGDLAVVHPDGYIELKDRKKDVIISGGENISSVEVEKTLMEHPAVLETC
ncbi:MAG: AMP-binding protein, partial [Acidimicrobiales bacterium]|nr:AMP-binding protein [Acidimicrobiales bacterium]